METKMKGLWVVLLSATFLLNCHEVTRLSMVGNSEKLIGCWKFKTLVKLGHEMSLADADSAGLLTGTERSIDSSIACFCRDGTTHYDYPWGKSAVRRWSIIDGHLVCKRDDGSVSNDELLRFDHGDLYTEFEKRFWIHWEKQSEDGDCLVKTPDASAPRPRL